jgi:hypothetical protein
MRMNTQEATLPFCLLAGGGSAYIASTLFALRPQRQCRSGVPVAPRDAPPGRRRTLQTRDLAQSLAGFRVCTYKP